MKQTQWKSNKNGSVTIYVPANQTDIMRWIIQEGEAGLEVQMEEFETEKEAYEMLMIDTKKPWFGITK